MLPRLDALKIQPVGASNPILPVAPAADPRQQEFERALAGQLGKTMRADVLAKLSDGSYMVKVADTPARMMLPASTQVGSSVTLQLVATSPRPTFQFDTHAPGNAPTVAYAEADASYEPSAAAAHPRGAPLVYAPGAHPVSQPPAQLQQAPAGSAPRPAALPLPASAADGPEAAPPGTAAAAPSPGAAAPMAQARPGSLAALLLSQAPLVPASQLPEIDPGSTPSQLSQGGRVISDVLASAARLPAPPAAVVASTPLLDARPVDAQHVAQLLKEAVGRSGLFYESHLREWSAGERPLAEIAREPQMQRAAEGQPPRNPATDPASAGFVNLQLATQEQGRIAWLGQLLPGQPVEWEIERDPPGEDGRRSGDEAPAWRSGMTFRFEGLGEISASVVLAGGQVHLRLDAGSDGAAGLLRSRMHELDASLQAAGATLASFAVRSGDADA